MTLPVELESVSVWGRGRLEAAAADEDPVEMGGVGWQGKSLEGWPKRWALSCVIPIPKASSRNLGPHPTRFSNSEEHLTVMSINLKSSEFELRLEVHFT